MRISLFGFVFLVILSGLLLACDAVDALPRDLREPIQLEEAQKFAATCPVSNPEQAARMVLRFAGSRGPWQRVGAQNVVSVRQSTFGDAMAEIYTDRNTIRTNESPTTPVWLVELQGMWAIAPPESRSSYTPRLSRTLVTMKASEPCGIVLGYRVKDVVVYNVD